MRLTQLMYKCVRPENRAVKKMF